MKISISSKIRWFIILLLFFTVLQGAIIIHIIHNSVLTENLKQNIQNTIYIITFIEFIFVLIFFFYIPGFIKKSFSIVLDIISTISEGNYLLYKNKEDIPTSKVKEIDELIKSLVKMLNSILEFDSLKKEKISVHHNRIKAILKLTKDGFLILDLKGNIVYMNDIVPNYFPSITENSNMLETNFPPEIENNIKKYIISVFKMQSTLKSMQFFIPSLKRHITMESALVRNHEGKIRGAVIAIINLEKKKSD